MIKKITCCGYRGFAQEQTLELAVPNGKIGSGLTVLIGPNGGGKSTLVECFSKMSMNDPSFTEGKRNKLAGDRVKISITYSDGQETVLSSVETGGSETVRKNRLENYGIYYLPSRRVFNPYFSKSEWDRNTFLQNPEDPQFRGSLLNNFTYRLFDANKKGKDFNVIFWKILGKKLEWTIDQDDNRNYYVKIKKGDVIYHNSDGLGEGIVSLLFIVDAIFEAKDDELIVIDEPELSLHPQLQGRLLEEILELTKRVQVVISTHSPNMISIESAINGGVVARIYEKDNSSNISCIDECCREYFRSCFFNLNNPHTMGSDARSCFFAEDGYIITEGQEDVMLFPKILKELDIKENIPFFGFGAGGASNIDKIAHIFKCLGFAHIGAIFDGDKKDEYEDFIRKYENIGYKAWIIPADDVRDKPEVKKEAKLGLLDTNRKIKPQYKKDLIKMFKDILTYSQPHN